MADYDRRGSGGGSSYNPKKRRYRGELRLILCPSFRLHPVSDV
jgi:hypothetical protein